MTMAEPEWRTAAPLWETNLNLDRPALLKFSSDKFMDEFVALLNGAAGEDTLSNHLSGGDALKLYQPVHGVFNLVAASLVCALPRRPDRTINAPTEKVAFVLRRLGPVVNHQQTE